MMTDEIEAELDALAESDPDVADAAELLLEILYENRDLLARLHQPNTYPLCTPIFEVKRFIEAQRAGYNIYILKFQDLVNYKPTNYRVFLGFHAQKDIYYALAITNRSHSYNSNGSSYRSLCDRYERYNIPKI